MSTPVQRSTDLTVQPIGDELLVFDTVNRRAHSLNATAMTVWEACDGTRDPDALAAHTGLSRDVVDLALTNLTNCHLLDGTDPVETVPRPVQSRRQMLRNAALTGASIGVALPVIRSIAAPSAAQAQSGFTCPGNVAAPYEHCSPGCNSCIQGYCCCSVPGGSSIACVVPGVCATDGGTCV